MRKITLCLPKVVFTALLLLVPLYTAAQEIVPLMIDINPRGPDGIFPKAS